MHKSNILASDTAWAVLKAGNTMLQRKFYPCSVKWTLEEKNVYLVKKHKNKGAVHWQPQKYIDSLIHIHEGLWHKKRTQMWTWKWKWQIYMISSPLSSLISSSQLNAHFSLFLVFFLLFFCQSHLFSQSPPPLFLVVFQSAVSASRYLQSCVVNVGQHCWRQPLHKSVTFGLVLHGCCDCHVPTRKQTLHWEELGASDTFNSICCIIGCSYWFSFHDMEIHSHRSGHLIPNNFLTLRNMHAEAVRESALCPGLNWWTGMH